MENKTGIIKVLRYGDVEQGKYEEKCIMFYFLKVISVIRSSNGYKEILGLSKCQYHDLRNIILDSRIICVSDYSDLHLYMNEYSILYSFDNM